MAPYVAALVGLLGVLLLMALGIPIAASFAVAGFLGTIYLVGIDAALSNLALIPWSLSAQYSLMCLPLFLLMGDLSYHSEITRELFAAAYKWLGRFRGGLALATVAACTAFAAVSGSSLASAATIGVIAYPEMKRYGYNDKLATGCIAAGGTLAILIPPSASFILYGILAEVSIGKLFIAGIIPGLLLSGLFLLVVFTQCTLNPSLGPAAPSFPWKERFASLRGIWAVLVLFLLVMGGIYFGVFTATEAAAIGAFGAFVISLLRRRLTWQGFMASLLDAGQTTCMIFFIVIGAFLFNYFVGVSGLPIMLGEAIVNVRVPPLAVVALMMLSYAILGCFMEAFAMIVLTIPIFIPVVEALGFDLVWFGVLVVVMNELAQITPPVGLAVFVIKGVAKDVPLQDIFKGIFPFAAADVLLAGLILLFPQIPLFLVKLMK